MKIQITLIHEQDKESKMYFLRMIARILEMKVYKTLKFIIESLKIEVIEEVDTKQYSLEYISYKVCKYLNIDRKRFISKCRIEDYVEGRQIVTAIAWNMTKIDGSKRFNQYQIAEFFKYKDRSSISYSVKIVNNRIETDKQFAKQFSEIEKLFI